MFCQSRFIKIEQSTNLKSETRYGTQQPRLALQRRRAAGSTSPRVDNCTATWFARTLATSSLLPIVLWFPPQTVAVKSRIPGHICSATFSERRLAELFLLPRQQHLTEGCWPSAKWCAQSPFLLRHFPCY